MSMNRLLQLLTWISALILLGTVYSQLPFDLLPVVLIRTDLVQMSGWILLNILIIVVLAYRWQILVQPLNQALPFMALLMVRQAGQVVSFVTPGPQFGGEPLQVYWLWKVYSLSGHMSVLAVGLDRFYELWVNFAVLIFAVVLFGYITAITPQTWIPVLLLILVFICLLTLSAWVLVRFPERISKIIERITTRWQRVPVLSKLDVVFSRMHSELIKLLQKHKTALMMALLISIAGWLGMGLELWMLLSFFDPAPTVSGFILLFIAVRLAFLLPLPGGIGTLEAAVFWVCQLLGLPGESAVGLIVLMRVRDALIMGAGILALRRLNHLASS